MKFEVCVIILILLTNAKFLSFVLGLPLAFVYSILHDMKSKKDKVGTPSETMSKTSLSKSEKNSVRKRKLLNFIDGYIRYISYYTAHIPSHKLRKLVYKYCFLVKMGNNAVLYYGSEIRASWNLMIGEGSIIGDNSILDARRGGIIFGKNVNVGSNVHLWTDGHDMNDPYFRSMPTKRGKIIIGDRVWIGPSVTILHSVKIGEGAVIAAGAVVTKDVAPFSIVAGIPAMPIGSRSKDLLYEFKGNHLHFL